MTSPAAELPRVVIVGAGFGGLYAARALANRPVRVTLIDRHNYHLFTPLLYQVAAAALSPGEIAQPIRSVVRAPNVDVVMAEVVGIDLSAKIVRLRVDAEAPDSSRATHRRLRRSPYRPTCVLTRARDRRE